MNLREPLALLGGLSPAAFMRDVWQKRPLLIRNAFPPVGAVSSSMGAFWASESCQVSVTTQGAEMFIGEFYVGADGAHGGPARQQGQ